MAEYMQKVAKMGQELSVEERNLFSVACKNIVGARRASWRIISLLEQKETKEGDETKQELTKEYREKVEKELEDICNNVLELLETHLLKYAESDESRIFYRKMKGDYNRYLAEFSTGDRRKQVANLSRESYEDAMQLAEAKLAVTHPIRLGLALNFSVFYYEIMNSTQEACDLAKKVLKNSLAIMESFAEDYHKDSTLILQLLRDNLQLWESDLADNATERIE